MIRMSSVDDARIVAQRRLPRFLFDYIDGGAGAEQTLADNMAALRSIKLRQRVLRDVSEVDISTELFGRRHGLPAVLAPVGLTGLYARRGEVQAARAAQQHDLPFCLSTVSVCSIEEVAAASAKPVWFQLYMIRDRAFMRDLIERARIAGAAAMVFTVDMPVPGARRRDVHSGLSGDYAAFRRWAQIIGRPAWAWDVGIRGRPHTLGNIAPVLKGATGLDDFMGWLGANFDASIQWSDLEWIRSAWDGPLIIKGILDTDDARNAVRLGADGIVVSNHGGRQLDGAPASVAMLPEIAETVGGSTAVLCDSGVRSGADIIRMLALGADAVMLGRAWVYGLAAGGQRGVQQVLDILAAEMKITMALSGTTNLREINSDVISETRRHM